MHINNFINGSSIDRKRKRRDLQVRFSTEPCEIIDTYSSLDYDRGGLFPDASTFNNNIILTLSFGFVPTETAPPPIKKQKGDKKRPKLSIDTSNHDGPLYFTSMTTNHQKREQQQMVEDDHDARITMENTEMNRRCLVAAA